jgi:hypothetical protein
MLIILFDSKGIVCKKFVLAGETVNENEKNWKASILTQLKWLRQNVRRCWTPSQNTTSRVHLKLTVALKRCIHPGGAYFEGDGGQ